MSAMPDSLSAGSKKTENTFSRLKRKRNEKKLLSKEILSRSNCARPSDERKIREPRRLVAQTDSIYVLIDMNYLLTGARQLVHFTRITVESYFAGPRLTYISIGLNYSRQTFFYFVWIHTIRKVLTSKHLKSKILDPPVRNVTFLNQSRSDGPPCEWR